MTMIHVIHVDNGWIYWFSFSGSSSDKYFSDFRSLLNTVTYPQTQENDSKLQMDQTSVDNIWAIIVLICMVASVVVVMIFTWKRQQKKEESQVQIKECANNMAQYCRKCGALLPIDSEFCHKCGTKIINNR